MRGLTSGNYAIAFVDGTLTIALPASTPRAVVAGHLQSKTHDMDRGIINLMWTSGRPYGLIWLLRRGSMIQGGTVESATVTTPKAMVVCGTLGSQHFRIDAFEGAKKVPSTYRLRLTDGFDTATFVTLPPDVEIITP